MISQLLTSCLLLASGAIPQARLVGVVIDENAVPVAGVQITVRSPDGQAAVAYSDVAGRFVLDGLALGACSVTLNKAGYFRLEHRDELKEGTNEISYTFQHETEIKQSVEVNSSADPIEPREPDHREILVEREIRDLPVPNSHDLQSVLPALPGIIRDNAGQLHVAGGRAGETQYLLDGFDIGDPVTGTLTTRLNVDTVRQIEVEGGRYGSQYGLGGAGVLAMDTTVGDDKWRAGTTNFIPSVSVQQGVHLGNWYPRFTLSGPIEKGRAWFSEALSLQHTFGVISELPRGANTSTQWAGDNLLRAQINLTPRNLLQGSFLYNRRRSSRLNLGAFSPASTTTNLDGQRSFVSVRDQAWTGRAFFDAGVAADVGHQDILPMGSQPYIVQPSATAGNYFESLRRQARRWQAMAGVTLPSRQWHGSHNLQAGVHFDHVNADQTAARGLILVERQDGALLQQTTFAGPTSYHLTDARAGLYLQDAWSPFRPLVVQLGLRGDWDRFLHDWAVSPRVAANIVPWSDDRARLAVAWGAYCQPLRLGDVGPAFDQQRLDTFFDPTGTNPVTGPVTSRFVLPSAGLKLPRFKTASVEWTQKLGKGTFAGLNFTSRTGRDQFAYELQPQVDSTRVFLLQNNRQDRYRAVQFSLRHSFGDKGEFSASYTRSRARSNQVLDYSLSTLIFAPQQQGPLQWDAPNRFISSGWAPVPFWDLFLSYFFEYRTGFPFSVVNQQQQLVGAPNRLRFPDYLSLNLGIEKRFRLFSRVWALRLAVVNAGGRLNPDTVINNLDSPDFLQYAGGQKRAFTARIRLVK